MTEIIKPDPKNLIAPEDFKPHWNHEVTDVQYHSDKTALSSTALRKALKSMRSFHNYFVDGVDDPTPAMKFGTMAHCAILEGQKFFDRYAVMPVFSGYTQKGELTTNPNCKEVKDKKLKWEMELPPGTKIVTQEELDKLKWMIDSIVDHPIAFALLKNGMPEAAGYYRDPVTGIRCRIKLDFLSFDLDTLVDVKTCANCTEVEFMRSVFKPTYRPDIQMAMYDEGIFLITGKRPAHRAWIAVESDGDHEVAVHELGPVTDAIGKAEYRRLLDKVKVSIDNNDWPRYQSVAGVAEPPPWIVQQYQLMGVI